MEPRITTPGWWPHGRQGLVWEDIACKTPSSVSHGKAHDWFRALLSPASRAASWRGLGATSVPPAPSPHRGWLSCDGPASADPGEAFVRRIVQCGVDGVGRLLR